MQVSSRYVLADLPTPLERMNRLSGAIGGPEIWIKRDDQTGLATGTCQHVEREIDVIAGVDR